MRNLLIVYLFCQFSIGQNQKLGVVIDAENKSPIEFVDVYSTDDNTITNENGKYFILSVSDSISFSKLGYQTLRTTFSALNDTVYLPQKVFELSEITLTNEESLFDRFKKAVPTNYPSKPYKEAFFIRSTLRYNGKIARIQDIQGKLQRRTLLYHSGANIEKNDFLFEVENMRKVGVKEVTENETNIYFIFRSLKEILLQTVQLSIVLKDFEIKEKLFDDQSKVRIDFNYNGDNEKINTKGYYIINLKDNAMLEFYQLAKLNFDFSQKKNIKYRVTRFEKNVLFQKNLETGKYIMTTAKIKTKVETKNIEETFLTHFESEDIVKSYNHFANFKVKKNVNENKDIFKLNYKYHEPFWNAQNQLLLTDEMHDFIQKLAVKNKEFKIRSNMY